MTEFFPKDFDQAPIMPLEVATYRIRSTLFNPDTNKDMPVPDHAWVVVDVSSSKPAAVARSTPSDDDGVCGIGLPSPIDKGTFAFLLLPSPKDTHASAPDAELIRSNYKQKDGEAWIDLDQTDRWAVPPTPASTLELRRLMRIPAWSTIRKATLGGFKVSPPGTTKFASQGIIPIGEFKKFGPWDMPLDFNWARARIEFSFVDWQQNKFDTLPPGVVIEAQRTLKTGEVVRAAAGVSGSLKDRSCYLLLEGDKTVWKACHFQFKTPGACFIDLSGKKTPTPDDRIKLGQPSTSPPAKLDDFNPLPPAWHSLGMRANFTTSAKASGVSPPAGASSPRTADKLWDGLRFDLAKAADGDNAAISFHLDDIVLCTGGGVPIKKNRTSPLTLLDHLLTIINPDPQAAYQTAVKRIGLIVPAPDALQIPAVTGANMPPPRHQSTRLIHFEGGLHDVRNDRVLVADARLGKDPCVGARAAVLGSHGISNVASPQANPRFPSNLGLEMHLIDVPEVIDPATKAPLLHLMLYVPTRIDASGAFNPTTALADTRQLLNDAAEIWSPGHPGSKAVTSTKRYALLPSKRDPTKPPSSVIRFRTFFAERKAKPKLIIALTRDKSAKRDGRSNTAAGSASSPTKIVYFDSAVLTDQSLLDPQGDEGDGTSGSPPTLNVSSPFLTLTHELGHAAFGLMDEYVEAFDTQKAFGLVDSPPVLPSFGQVDEGFTDFRPFYSDSGSLMNDNHVPRLRHYWHHAKNFDNAKNADGRFVLPDAPFDLVHETFKSRPGTNPDGTPDAGTSLTYRVPATDARSPWLSFFANQAIPGGFGRVAFFALGEDEGAVEALFKTSPGILGLPKEARMQGLAIVRSKICFILDKAFTPKEKLNILQANFQSKIYTSKYALKIRFMLVPKADPKTKIRPSAPTKFERVAVLFQPHYSVDAKDIGAADVVFDISKTAKPARPNPFLTKITAKQVNVMAADFNFELAWRLVLGIPTALPGGAAPDLGVLRTTDLDPVARMLEPTLAEPANFREVIIFT